MKKQGIIISGMYSFSLPSQIIMVVMAGLPGMIDSFVVGNMFDADALAVLGILNPVMIIVSGFSLMMASGTRKTLSAVIGQGQYGRIKRHFSTAFNLSWGFALIIVLIACLTAGPVFEMFGLAAVYDSTAAGYFHIMAIGFVPCILNPFFIVFLSMEGHVRYCAAVTVLTGAVNAAAAVLLVEFARDNLVYVGIASTGSMYLGTALLAARLSACSDSVSFKTGLVSRKEIRNILRNGVPSAVSSAYDGVRLALLNAAAMSIAGIDAVSGISVYSGAVFILGIFIRAPKESNRFVAGIAANEHDAGSLYNIMKKDAVTVFPVAAGLAAVFFVFSPQIASLYGVSGEVLKYASLCISMYALAYVPEYIFTQLNSVYNSALGRTGYSFVLKLTVMLLIPCALLITGWAFSDIYFVFSVLIIAYTAGVIIQIAVSCVKNGRFSLKPIDIVWAEKTFAEFNEKVFSCCVTEIPEAAAASENVSSFSIKSGSGRRTAFFAGLCTEEITAMILKCMEEENMNGRGAADVLVSVRKDYVKIRLRDNASLCDRAAVIREEGRKNAPECDSRGLRIISHTAVFADYRKMLGINHTYLIIREKAE